MLLIFLMVIIYLTSVQTLDEYVRENFDKCATTKDQYYCAKYNFLRFIRDFEYEWTNSSVVNFIKISDKSDDTATAARYREDDSEFQKFFKFLMRRMFAFLGSHGLAFILPQGMGLRTGRSLDLNSSISSKSADFFHQLVWKDKIKLKKISKIILIKLLKIKIMLAMTFFVLLKVLKILLVAALLYPTVYNNIKAACEKPDYGWFG